MARYHYDILQISPDSTAEEIQRAYHRLAVRYHPDRNPSVDTASQMAALNDAYAALCGSSPSSPRNELAAAILDAARAVIQRHGWVNVEEDGRTAVFATGKPPLRIVLTDKLNGEILLRLLRRHRPLAAVLAIQVSGPFTAAAGVTIVDLMRAELSGSPAAAGACRSLLSGFL